MRREFGVPVTGLDALREAMVRRATRAAEKIRHQELVATWPIVFAHGATGPICARRAARPGCRRSVTIRASSSALQPRRWRRCFSPGASIRSAAFCSRNCCRKPRSRGTSLPSRIRARAGCWPLWLGTTIGSGVGPSGTPRRGFGARAFDTKRKPKKPGMNDTLGGDPDRPLGRSRARQKKGEAEAPPFASADHLGDDR